MSDKVYLGQNASDLDYDEKAEKISRVNLAVDIDHIYTSGDDTGRTLEVSCPWGSQAMADSILAKVSGIEYQPYEASDVLLDPATEIGDGITLGGVYSVLAQSYVSLDKQCAANISAPYTDEIDDEYPSQGPVTQQFNRKLAQTRSLIAKTAEEIRLEVAGVEDEISYIQLDLESITSRVQDAEGNISTLEQTATSLRSEISGKLDGDEAQSLIDQTLEGIELSVSSSGGSTTFRLTADGVLLSTKTLDLTVDAVNISGTLTAGAMRGGTVSLLTSAEREAGGMDITGASTSTYAIELWSYGALRMEAYNGAAYLGSGDAHVHVEEDATTITNGNVGIELSNHVWIGGNLFPNSPDDYLCGNANYPWSAVYISTGACISSDENKKNSIEPLPEKYLTMIDNVTPLRFKLNSGTSGRYHAGFGARNVKAAMDIAGIADTEFGGWVRDYDEEGNEIYMLRYEEYIPIQLAKAKQQDNRFEALEARVARLEEKA